MDLRIDLRDLSSWSPIFTFHFLYIFRISHTYSSIYYSHFFFFLVSLLLISLFFSLEKYTHEISFAQLQMIIYTAESEETAATDTSSYRTSISGTIWSMCFVSLDSQQPSKEHNPVLAVVLNRYGDL